MQPQPGHYFSLIYVTCSSISFPPNCTTLHTYYGCTKVLLQLFLLLYSLVEHTMSSYLSFCFSGYFDEHNAIISDQECYFRVIFAHYLPCAQSVKSFVLYVTCSLCWYETVCAQYSHLKLSINETITHMYNDAA